MREDEQPLCGAVCASAPYGGEERVPPCLLRVERHVNVEVRPETKLGVIYVTRGHQPWLLLSAPERAMEVHEFLRPAENAVLRAPRRLPRQQHVGGSAEPEGEVVDRRTLHRQEEYSTTATSGLCA